MTSRCPGKSGALLPHPCLSLDGAQHKGSRKWVGFPGEGEDSGEGLWAGAGKGSVEEEGFCQLGRGWGGGPLDRGSLSRSMGWAGGASLLLVMRSWM